MKCVVKSFLDECTQAVAGASAPVPDLWKAFNCWCGNRAIPVMSRKSFGRKLCAVAGRPVPTVTGHTILLGRLLTGVPAAERRPLLVLPAGLTAEDVAALSLIAAERARQITVEGYTPEHDDEHSSGDLELAGGEYLINAGSHSRDHFPAGQPADLWPWSSGDWKPTTRVRDGVKGCALGVAGIAARLRRGEPVEG